MIIPIDQKKKITTPIKYAAVAPNKIFKTAVLRNHTRRKIYEAIYKAENTISESVEPKNQLYIALFAKATITDVDFETLTKNTRDVLSSFFPKV